MYIEYCFLPLVLVRGNFLGEMLSVFLSVYRKATELPEYFAEPADERKPWAFV